MHQHRRFSRLPLPAFDLVCCPMSDVFGQAMKVRDFSPGGIGFVVDADLPSERPFEVRLKTDQFSIVVDAQVRWCKKDDFSDGRVGGLEFINLSNEARSLLLIFYTQQLLDEFPKQ